MNRAESALATAARLAEAAAEERRLGRIVQQATGTCWDGGYVEADEDGAGGHVSHLTMYLRGSLRRPALDACPTCRAAYEAIQDRKAVRRRRGALRAALVRIGKLALKEERTTP
jgi:hypothetical protein